MAHATKFVAHATKFAVATTMLLKSISLFTFNFQFCIKLCKTIIIGSLLLVPYGMLLLFLVGKGNNDTKVHKNRTKDRNFQQSLIEVKC